MLSKLLITACQVTLPALLAVLSSQMLSAQTCGCAQNSPNSSSSGVIAGPATPCATCGARPSSWGSSAGAVGGADGQNLNTTLIAQFPPNTATTYSFPQGTLPQVEYCMCTGQYDPVTGSEFAIASAENGYLFVHTVVPSTSTEIPDQSTMDTWFFEDSPSIRNRHFATSTTEGGIPLLRTKKYSVGVIAGSN